MQIFLAVWRSFYRQKSNLFFVVVFPSILVFILGTLLEQWNISEYDIPKMCVAYVAAEDYPAFEQFLAEMEREELFTVDRVETKEEALGQLEEHYTAVLVYEAEESRIDFYQSSEGVTGMTLHTILEGYAALEEAAILSLQNGVVPGIPSDSNYIVPKNLGVERSMLDYYAVCMLVMILFMGGGMSAGMSFYEYRKNGLFLRMAQTPIGKIKAFFMMVLGNLPMIALEIGSVMICSVAVFGAHYCGNLLDNLALILFFAIAGGAVVSFSAIAGLALRINPTGLMLPVSWVLLFFSGSFARIKMGNIQQYMPPWQIQEAAFDLTLFGNYGRILQVGGVCLLCSILFCVAGAAVFHKKGGMA